jgi:hypothetical protein
MNVTRASTKDPSACARFLIFGMLAMLVAGTVPAQRPEPEVVAEIGGDPVYQVVSPGAIPAITEPTYVSGEDADGQMSDNEPVLGVVIDGKARAYSLWHLDAHEIVNDQLAGVALAATW